MTVERKLSWHHRILVGQTRPLPPGVISHGLTRVHPTSQVTVARRTDDAHLVGVDRPRGDGGHWGQSSVDGDYGSQVRDSRSSQSHRPARHTAKCFTVLADETTDSGRKEQLAVCVRYVHVDDYHHHHHNNFLKWPKQTKPPLGPLESK